MTLEIFQRGYTSSRSLSSQLETIPNDELTELKQDIHDGDARRLKGVYRNLFAAITQEFKYRQMAREALLREAELLSS